MKTFLAVTSIEDAIDKEAEKVVYIEDGCLKKKKKTEGFEVVEKPFTTTEEISKHILIVKGEYEKILYELSIKLNEIHHKELSVKAWRVILCMWLPCYLEAMYSKYFHVMKAINDYDNLYSNVLSENSYIHPYYGYGCWIWMLKREDYNFQLYSHIIEFLQIEIKNRVDIKRNYNSAILNKKNNLKDIGKKLFNTLTMSAKTVIVNPQNFELTFGNMIKLCIKSGFQMGFFYSNAFNIVPEEYNKEYRKRFELKSTSKDSEFAKLVKKYIFEDIPTMYLEGFSKYINEFDRYRCKKIISAEDYPFYPAALLMGINENKKGKLYSIPFGGDGDIWQGMSEAYLDSTISDVLYTIGWKNEELDCELRKITNPRYWKAKMNMKHMEKTCDILYVATATYAYCTHLSSVNSMFTKEYIEDSLKFLSDLSYDSEMKIRARFFCETGWQMEERMRISAKNVKTDDYTKRFIDTVQESKLCVVDSFGTPWAEALAMNIPIIIIIPEYREFFSKNGWELVNKLKTIGVFHSSYKGAVKYIQKIIHNIEVWWGNNERQNVIRQVKEKYVWCADNAKKEWMDEFISISKE